MCKLHFIWFSIRLAYANDTHYATKWNQMFSIFSHCLFIFSNLSLSTSSTFWVGFVSKSLANNLQFFNQFEKIVAHPKGFCLTKALVSLCPPPFCSTVSGSLCVFWLAEFPNWILAHLGLKTRQRLLLRNAHVTMQYKNNNKQQYNKIK